MSLSVDTRKIVWAKVVPWEEDEGEYGVAYETTDGQSGADRIGPKKEAQAIIREIARRREQPFNASMNRVSRIHG
jgi:hypothetical protein